ncbi:MAG: hypothetical protein ACJAT7_000108 [Psychromonas sp.]|jgi:hypothetical protein|uniref:hypothetical protein n=1 Tax=Psychromonas sp. TaxID=1884585 RepID=UPI0039E3AEE8
MNPKGRTYVSVGLWLWHEILLSRNSNCYIVFAESSYMNWNSTSLIANVDQFILHLRCAAYSEKKDWINKKLNN